MKKSKYVLLLTFMFVLAFGGLVFADNTINYGDGQSVTFPNLPSDFDDYVGSDYFVVHTKSSNGELLYFYGSSDCKVKLNSDNYIYYMSETCPYYEYDCVSKEWTQCYSGSLYPAVTNSLNSTYPVIYSTYNIINSDDGSVFFQAPNRTFQQTLQKINLGGSLSEVILLLPLVLLAIVLYLGLRKALNFVFQVLRQA